MNRQTSVKMNQNESSTSVACECLPVTRNILIARQQATTNQITARTRIACQVDRSNRSMRLTNETASMTQSVELVSSSLALPPPTEGHAPGRCCYPQPRRLRYATGTSAAPQREEGQSLGQTSQRRKMFAAQAITITSVITETISDTLARSVRRSPEKTI